MLLYKEAALITKQISEKKGSIKSLVLNSRCQNKKQLQALVCESLKFCDVLDLVLASTGVQKLESLLKADPHLTRILLYEHLFGKGLKGDGKWKDALLRHKAALQAGLARLKIKAGVTKNQDLIAHQKDEKVSLPRYVRVNTLKTSSEEVIQHFKKEKFSQLPVISNDYQRFVESVQGLTKHQFVCDPHIPQLLVFPSGTDLHDHVLYRNGDIILQDKASCIPAHVLAPTPGSHVIDCCAAPGNKTTHLSAIMANKGKVFAFDKDIKRVSTLNTMTLRAGASCVKVVHGDFLRVDPTDPQYRDVKYVLVDPSCSGSGIVNRMDALVDGREDKDPSSNRLEKLASFQATILKHALSFPAVQRVVYSTCSVHTVENEGVVADVMGQVGHRFSLEEVLPALAHRGQGQWGSCVRMSAGKDATNGFFVACFVRREDCMSSTTAESLVGKDPMSTESQIPVCEAMDTSSSMKSDISKKPHEDPQQPKQKKSKKRKNPTELNEKGNSEMTVAKTLKSNIPGRQKTKTNEAKQIKLQPQAAVSGPVKLQQNKKSKKKQKNKKHRPITA